MVRHSEVHVWESEDDNMKNDRERTLDEIWEWMEIEVDCEKPNPVLAQLQDKILKMRKSPPVQEVAKDANSLPYYRIRSDAFDELLRIINLYCPGSVTAAAIAKEVTDVVFYDEKPSCGKYGQCTEACSIFWGCPAMFAAQERARIRDLLLPNALPDEASIGWKHSYKHVDRLSTRTFELDCQEYASMETVDLVLTVLDEILQTDSRGTKNG
jgi:hypothetical protein